MKLTPGNSSSEITLYVSSRDWHVGSVGFTWKLRALDWVPGPACSQGEDGEGPLRQGLRAGGQVSGEKWGPGLGPGQRWAGQRDKGRGHQMGRGGQRRLLSRRVVLQVSRLPEQQQPLGNRSLCPSRFCPSPGCPHGTPHNGSLPAGSR